MHILVKQLVIICNAFAFYNVNTIRVMDEAPVLIAVLNTNSKNPFMEIKRKKRMDDRMGFLE